jgi:large subunit ribosomal protein L10
MALSKDKKKQLIDEVTDLLSGSKMTVMVKYQGTSVKAMQDLRKSAKESGTKVKVEDEVAPAQSLNAFAKTNPQIEFVGAISAEGKLLSSEEVKALAVLPSKNELIAQVIATLASPLNDVMNGLSGNLHGLLDGVQEKASN